MSEELADLKKAHIGGVTFFMKEDIAADPSNIRILGAQRIMLKAGGIADAVKQLLILRKVAGHHIPLKLWSHP